MPAMIRKNSKAAVCLLLFAIVNILMLCNLRERNISPVISIESRKVMLLVQAAADLLILGVCRWYASGKRTQKSTAVLLFLSPVVNLVILETLAGHIQSLPPVAVGLNLAIAYAALLLFLLFFRRLRTALVFYSLWMPLLGLVQYYVHRFRGRSFMLNDLSSSWTAMQVAGEYSYALDPVAGAALLLLTGWLFLCLVTPDREIKRFWLVRKLAAVAVCVGCFFLLEDRTFTSRHNIFTMDMWEIEGNYRTKGYLLNLLSQIQYLKVDPPENYSVELVSEKAEKYRLAYDAGSHVLPEIQPENLIVIMNESWTDFRCFPDTGAGNP